MIYKTLINFLAIFFVVYGCSFESEAASRKPLPPVRIAITPVEAGITSDQIKPGDVIEFSVTAVSSIDAPKIEINVEFTGGAKLVSGESSWSGPAVKNEEKKLVFTVHAPEQGQGTIKARISIPPSDGTRFSAETEFVLGAKTKAKTDKEGTVKKDRKGRRITEYR